MALNKLQVSAAGWPALVGGEFTPQVEWVDGHATNSPRVGPGGLPLWSGTATLIVSGQQVTARVIVESSSQPEVVEPRMVVLSPSATVTVGAPFRDMRGLQLSLEMSGTEYAALVKPVSPANRAA